MKSDILAIIPARGGSKGIPRKNIAPLLGRPLISYSIEAARNCPLITRSIVSTEDEEIAKICRSEGAEVLARPADLARDHSKTEAVLVDALKQLEATGYFPATFVVLQPTSPMRTAQHITDAIRLFEASNRKCVWSVTRAEHHPYKDLVATDEGLKPVRDVSDLSARRQDLPTAFRQNGAIYIMDTALFLAHRTLFVTPVIPFEMRESESIDIDNYADLKRTEELAQLGFFS